MAAWENRRTVAGVAELLPAGSAATPLPPSPASFPGQLIANKKMIQPLVSSPPLIRCKCLSALIDWGPSDATRCFIGRKGHGRGRQRQDEADDGLSDAALNIDSGRQDLKMRVIFKCHIGGFPRRRVSLTDGPDAPPCTTADRHFLSWLSVRAAASKIVLALAMPWPKLLSSSLPPATNLISRNGSAPWRMSGRNLPSPPRCPVAKSVKMSMLPVVSLRPPSALSGFVVSVCFRCYSAEFVIF